ncbi:3-dehydroquinate synthase II [Candidatus Protochlamydia sp. W-9]|uniref:3-dehydroquinate synthase II n=1 Tax=Candidatus Protochlamydia sp. W-9 TaxID=1785087 RepID=UPI00096A8A3F|nr:3-dehydroquinate synthase II [Candidatus Protochlamydia sp. W-9]
MTLTHSQEQEVNSQKKDVLKFRRMAKKKENNPILWYNLSEANLSEDFSILSSLSNTIYAGVIFSSLQKLELFNSHISPKLTRILHLDFKEEFDQFLLQEDFANQRSENWVICSNHLDILDAAKKQGLSTCLRYYIDNNESLHQAIFLGKEHEYLMVCFKDPTNIPLELVIASLQFNKTKIIKEILDPENVDDALVSLDTMEIGADGIIFSPKKHEVLEAFLKKLENTFSSNLKLEIGEITKSIPVGIGHRACVDLATMFSKNEGILVGSTSSGGLLCCPEVFHLPYMELRPFRVNAGGVHSYIYNKDNKTNYISELKAGDNVLVVDLNGNVKQAVVGRVKIEVRPLRLIEAKFGNIHLNILLQDDWHVRIYSSEGIPLNISEIQIGQKVLGYLSTPGRHVGIQVEENILEK